MCLADDCRWKNLECKTCYDSFTGPIRKVPLLCADCFGLMNHLWNLAEFDRLIEE